MDDILIATKCNDNMIHIKNILKQKFKIKDQGKIKHFLGIEFTYEDNIIYMHQKQYLQRLQEKFAMKDCKPKYTPNDSNINKMCSEPSKLTDGKLYKEKVGSLIYAMTRTRPDICFIVLRPPYSNGKNTTTPTKKRHTKNDHQTL